MGREFYRRAAAGVRASLARTRAAPGRCERAPSPHDAPAGTSRTSASPGSAPEPPRPSLSALPLVLPGHASSGTCAHAPACTSLRGEAEVLLGPCLSVTRSGYGPACPIAWSGTGAVDRGILTASLLARGSPHRGSKSGDPELQAAAPQRDRRGPVGRCSERRTGRSPSCHARAGRREPVRRLLARACKRHDREHGRADPGGG